MHKYEVFEAVRSDGKSDKIDLIVDDEGKVHFDVQGNLAMMILHMVNNPDEESIHALKQISGLYEECSSGKAEIHVVNDPFEALRQIKENMEEGPEKDEIIKHIDTNKSQKIEYNEFLAACLEQKLYLREENLLSAFMMLDLDGSGKISKAEIKQALNKDIDRFFCL